MRRRLCAALLAVVATATLSAQRPTFNTGKEVTIVLKDGGRRAGTLVYHNNDKFDLIMNGREHPFPIADIAVVEFEAGAPPKAEIAKLPEGTPPELRLHMIALKDGSVIHGKLYTIKTSALTIDTPDRSRRDVDINTVARLYMDAAASRSLFK